jgi:hypothetical protein
VIAALALIALAFIGLRKRKGPSARPAEATPETPPAETPPAEMSDGAGDDADPAKPDVT